MSNNIRKMTPQEVLLFEAQVLDNKLARLEAENKYLTERVNLLQGIIENLGEMLMREIE